MFSVSGGPQKRKVFNQLHRNGIDFKAVMFTHKSWRVKQKASRRVLKTTTYIRKTSWLHAL